MNVQELSALAELKLNSDGAPLRDFKALHRELLLKEGLKASGETYKFTNMDRFLEEFGPHEEASPLPASDERAFVFIDGKLTSTPFIEGVRFSPLTEKNMAEVITPDSPLSHLHHGLMGEGLLLEVEKGREVTGPVRILHLIGQDNVTAPTLLIRMGEFSKMTLVEETGTSKKNYLQVSESYIQLKAGSKLEHVQLDQGPESSLQHGSTWSEVARDASYTSFIFHLNGKLNRRNLDIKLKESGANAQSYSLFLTSGEEHSDISTVINHEAPDTTSNQMAKGILGGESKAVFTGKIHIHPQAQRVVSGQINRNLLLSKKAHIHSQPQLEIFADDVKCSHGSTTGQLSEEEIFYFETRGIAAEKARTLLAYGFGLEVVLKIQDKELRQTVERAVLTSLKKKFHLAGGEQ